MIKKVHKKLNNYYNVSMAGQAYKLLMIKLKIKVASKRLFEAENIWLIKESVQKLIQ